MSLRAFHLLFIALSVVLAGFCAAWAVGQYRTGHQMGRGAVVADFAVGGRAIVGVGAVTPAIPRMGWRRALSRR